MGSIRGDPHNAQQWLDTHDARHAVEDEVHARAYVALSDDRLFGHRDGAFQRAAERHHAAWGEALEKGDLSVCEFGWWWTSRVAIYCPALSAPTHALDQVPLEGDVQP